MPILNRSGQISHGQDGYGAFINNVKVADGDNPHWYNQITLVYQHIGVDGTYLALYDTLLSPPVVAQIHPTGAVRIYASGFGQYAAWSPGVGTWAWDGWTTPGVLTDMGPDAAIAYIDGSGTHVREKTGTEWLLTDSNTASDVRLLGEGRAIWVDGGTLKTVGLPTLKVLAGQLRRPEAVVIDNKWWVEYFIEATGETVIHPFDSFDGYQLGPQIRSDMNVLEGTGTIRFAWGTSDHEEAGTIFYRDILTLPMPGPPGTGVIPAEPTVPLAPPGTPTVTIPGLAPTGTAVSSDGSMTLTSTATFGVAAAAEELVMLPIDIFPAYPSESGHGRIVHPILGAFDYEVKPDEWVNIDADAIIPPVWASSRTLTSAANVLWQGHLRDVVVEERWKALGGLAMPITQLRMLLAIWTSPMDPDVGYVHWFPNYITQVGFKVLPLQLSAGGQGIEFDDVVNYKDEHGEPIGWITAPVTFQLKLVERL